jgi:hypothetical protein
MNLICNIRLFKARDIRASINSSKIVCIYYFIIRVIKSRRIGWAGHVAHMGEMRNALNVLVGKPGRKRPLGRSRRRWERNIRMDLREIGWDGVDWVHMPQDKDH